LQAAVSSAIEAYVRDLPAARSGFTASVTATGLQCNPGASPWEGKQCVMLRRSIEAIAGHAPSSYPNHYGGDIRFPLRLLGVPAFGIGSRGGSFYGANEWVDIDDLVRLVAVLILAVARWNESGRTP
jgi:acetylornithine deacetylase/succinyl-diaminopimelate desuccinylase-like protein